MRIKKSSCNFEREPLISRFGFKGGYLSELWQSVVFFESDAGSVGVGLGTQSTLWSDAAVFSSNSESAGNSLMFAMTAFASNLAKEIEWDHPSELLDFLLPQVYECGRKITGCALRLTFALNSLVAVDNAAWQMWARERGITSFDEMIPLDVRPALSHHQDKLACIPLMSYGVSLENIRQAVEEGYFFLKIKIGLDPECDGDLDRMLEWDMQRLTQIHDLVKDVEVPFTDDGHVRYYFDANGRYDSKDRLMKFLDHAQKMGALERIILLEEPFPEESEIDVRDIPTRLAADESAHSSEDAIARMDMGYGAIALKPIAKTMTESQRIAKAAFEREVSCFCADLTVNPVLVNWNKNVAARLAPLPGMKVGVLESNGHQNYLNWEQMKSYHPCSGSSWIEPVDGIFHLDEDFYRQSGGILLDSGHYFEMVKM